MEPLITDWIESLGTAFGSILAGVAVYFGYKAYKKDRSDIQNQIDSLQLLAQHQQEENILLQKQIAVNANTLEIERRKRRSTIMPLFRKGNGTMNSDVYEISLHNHGEMAYNVELCIIENENNLIVTPVLWPEIGKQEGISFKIKSNDNKDVYSSKIRMELCFKDIDENNFRQVIENKGKGMIVNPVKLKHDITYSYI